MRWAVLLVAACILAGALLFLGQPSTSRPAPGGPGEAEPPGPAEKQDAALGRLREEIARAAPARRRTDEERLADARAWVAANRPHDWPYAEIEAWILANFEAMAGSEPRTAAWVMDNARLEIEMIRAVDADGDGLVSDDEADAFAAFSLESLSAENHPYVTALFDTDGDGVLSNGERAAIGSAEADLVRLRGVRERAEVDLWDADGDGLLSGGERSAGEQEWLRHQRVFDDGHIEHVAEPDDRTIAESASALAKLRELYGDSIAEQTLQRQKLGAAWALTFPLAEAMSLVERDTEQHADSPPPPDYASFDPDGDGRLDEEQLAAQMEATRAWQAAYERWRAAEHAERLRRLFAAAAAANDGNGDGLLTPEEWDARMNQLLADRDDRLLRFHYDLDASGRVDEAELDAFLSWYRVGSIRADANYDGRVDALDLEQMVSGYTRQGG